MAWTWTSKRLEHVDHKHDLDRSLYLGVYPDHECHHGVLTNLPFRAHDSDPSHYPYLCPYAYLYLLMPDPYLILIRGRDRGLDHDDLCPSTYPPSSAWVHPLLETHPSNLSVLIAYHLLPYLSPVSLHAHKVVLCPTTWCWSFKVGEV